MGTITKALDMLNLFSRFQPEIGLAGFVRLTGRDKATIHRHLVELEANGYLEQHPVTRAYRLGPAILRLSGVREATHPIRAILRPLVTELSISASELAHASLLQGGALSPVFHADPQCHSVRVRFDNAEMLPLHATASGLAVLAFAEPGVVERTISKPMAAYTGETVTDPARLRSMIAIIREQGYAETWQTFDDGVASLAAPIFDQNSRAVGALAVAIPINRADAGRFDQLLKALQPAANNASRSLGGELPAKRVNGCRRDTATMPAQV